MEAKIINLNDYVYTGEGANGESYNHKDDSSIMLKLYNATAPEEIIYNELELSHKVYDAGIPTPKPGELVTDGKGRLGIRFERIAGKISFSRATGDNPDKVEYYARRFARLCKVLHSTRLSRQDFPDIKEYDTSILDSLPFYTAEERAIMKRYIADAPDGDTAIHGDLQFSNAIMDGEKDYLIDLGDFACGSPLFDLGMVLFTCLYDNHDFMREVFHIEPPVAERFWHYFVKEYFGEDADPSQKEKELRPYAALKLLIIERNAGGPIPEYHWMIR